MAANNDDAVQNPAPEAPQMPAVAGPHPIVRFLREVQAELKKTNWPTRDELTKFTVVVMITIVVVAVYLYVSDLIVAHITGPLFGIAQGK